MADQEKIYCGSGKKRQDFARTISVCLDNYPPEFINEYKGKRYLRLNVVDKRQPDEYGKDVMVMVDTWKPESKQEPNYPESGKVADVDSTSNEDDPF
jgi:hypothetical protein